MDNPVFIRGVNVDSDAAKVDTYPYSIPAVRDIADFKLDTPVTFLVGENGSGKSTIIEAIAVAAGFSAEGGTKNYHYSTIDSTSNLADNMALIRGVRREKSGYFLRAESFYTTANYAESGTSLDGHSSSPLHFAGKRIHEQSHGEAFMAIVKDLAPGLFIFDEPESALSPNRLLHLMLAMRQLVGKGSQFIIATHSPILLAYPEATIYELSPDGIASTNYDAVEHVTVTRDFLNNPSTYLSKLFK